ncbi:MAG: hypothetical protein P1V97_19820 [Planctomycetota bacterium]|nr:hypothetical protein [Planctomycetota bacterium]
MTLIKDHNDGSEEADGNSQSGPMSIVLVFGILFLLAIPIVGVVMFVVLPGLEVKHEHGETSAYAKVNVVHAGQSIFFEREGNGRYGSLADLLAANYVNDALGPEVDNKYQFEVVAFTDKANVPKYWVKASPKILGVNGDRYFYSNETGIIYHSLQDFKVNEKTGKPDRELTRGRQ